MVECVGSLHVLQIMWMAHPNQADRPQGTHRVSDGLLVANDLGKAQAGNRAGKTGCQQQWWDKGSEWKAEASAMWKLLHSTLFCVSSVLF